MIALFAAAIAGSLAGCIPRVRPPGQAPVASTQSTGGPAFAVSALPVYRLVPAEALLDVPSRLLVVQLYLTSPEDAVLHFSSQDVVLVLPNRARARILDRPRAIELLRRTMFADANLAYLQRGDGQQPGGLSGYSQSRLYEIVAANLLAEGTFGAGQPLNGYIVIDTGAALMTLDGGAVEVVVHRVHDAAPGRCAYQFAAAPNVAEPAAEPQ